MRRLSVPHRGVARLKDLEDTLDALFQPLLGRAVVDMQEALTPVIRLVAACGAPQSAQLVVNQATNDLQDLVRDLWRGSGRSAARVARALYEHSVNFCEVSDNPTSADRYEAHATVAAQLEAGLEVGLHRLRGKEHKSARHALHKLGRDSKRRHDAALAQYGPSFRRDWAADNLRDRATRHGLDADYDAYRLLSAVLHGSAGGARGTVSSAYRAPVHRNGPSLELCVLAYHEGLRYFRHLAGELGKRHQDVDVAPLVAALDRLLGLWPAYRELMLAVDRRLWPTSAPAHPTAVLAVYGHRFRWY